VYRRKTGAWLRRCATSRKVPESIPGGVTLFFSDIFLSDRSMTLGSTQPLVKMSTRNISGGKGGRCVRLTTSPPSCAVCHEIWEPKPPGTLWATSGLSRDSCITVKHLAAEAVRRIRQAIYAVRNFVESFHFEAEGK
jgi:hypothetical protein